MKYILLHLEYRKSEFVPTICLYKTLMGKIWFYHRLKRNWKRANVLHYLCVHILHEMQVLWFIHIPKLLLWLRYYSLEKSLSVLTWKWLRYCSLINWFVEKVPRMVFCSKIFVLLQRTIRYRAKTSCGVSQSNKNQSFIWIIFLLIFFWQNLFSKPFHYD